MASHKGMLCVKIITYSVLIFIQMDQTSLPDSNVPLSGRSLMIRERLHGEDVAVLLNQLCQ